MKRKIFAIALTVALATTAFVGCAKKADPTTAAQKPAATDTKKTDAVTSASIVDSNTAFEKAIGPDGKYITAILKDMTFDKELVVDGDKKNGKKDAKTGEELFQRKIALYTQDDKHNVTARFTLTAPKITFKAVNGSLEHGTFKGDVYISGKNFKLIDNKVDGNVYFLNEDAKKTFTKDDKSVVTGKIEACY